MCIALKKGTPSRFIFIYYFVVFFEFDDLVSYLIILSLLESSLSLAESIAKKSPVAVQTVKKSLIYSRDHTVDEGLEHIVRNLRTLFL